MCIRDRNNINYYHWEQNINKQQEVLYISLDNNRRGSGIAIQENQRHIEIVENLQAANQSLSLIHI